MESAQLDAIDYAILYHLQQDGRRAITDIAAEMGHVYGELGADISIIGRSTALLPDEDVDIRETFTDAFEQRHDVHTGYEAKEVSQNGEDLTVTAESDDGAELTVTGDELLVATGRRPNSDKLAVDEAGI